MIRLLPALCGIALMTLAGTASAQQSDSVGAGSDIRCVKLCVALLQAIGDEVKERIFLTCDQITGVCKGDGHLTLVEQRVPVSINSTLDGDILTLRIDSPTGGFSTDEGDDLTMEIGPYMPWQVGQFVIQPKAAGSDPGALVVTILVEKMVEEAPGTSSPQ